MNKKCLKCGHERNLEDGNPKDCCPNCGAYYAKVEAALKRKADEALGRKRKEAEPKPQAAKTLVCRACEKTVSRSLDACPHCGEPIGKKKPKRVKAPPPTSKPLMSRGAIYTLLFFVFAGGWAILDSARNFDPNEPPPPTVECGSDIQCLDAEHGIEASFKCADKVEALAKYNHRWIDGVIEPKFPKLRWANQERKEIAYLGDAIEFQNGFGSYIRHRYVCVYSTSLGQALTASATPGKY